MRRKTKPVTRTANGKKQEVLEELVRRLEQRPGVSVSSTGYKEPSSPRKSPKKFAAAKTRYYPGTTLTTSTAYRGMNKYYREYRRNFLVRKAIDSLAYWSVKEGFETVLEPGPAVLEKFETEEAKQAHLDQYSEVKSYVDKTNSAVNLDLALRIAVIKTKIFGKAAFEIEFEHQGKPWASQPTRLIPLDSTQMKPNIDDNWNLTGFTYEGKEGFYLPEEVLYFVNSDLEGDWEGLSEIEPILKEAELDDKIMREDLTEAATTLWAGIAVHTLLTEKLPEGTNQEEVQKIIDDHVAELRPGKHIATTDQWQIQVVDIEPDLNKLINISDKVERRIVGNFQVPRFMLNIEKELNRATAYAELESFVDGPITDIQRMFKRTLEAQWYPRLAGQKLRIADGNLPVLIKHRWRQIRTADWFELIKAASQAYGTGVGWADRKKIYEMLRDGTDTHFDPAELEQPVIE